MSNPYTSKYEELKAAILRIGNDNISNFDIAKQCECEVSTVREVLETHYPNLRDLYDEETGCYDHDKFSEIAVVHWYERHHNVMYVAWLLNCSEALVRKYVERFYGFKPEDFDMGDYGEGTRKELKGGGWHTTYPKHPNPHVLHPTPGALTPEQLAEHYGEGVKDEYA